MPSVVASSSASRFCRGRLPAAAQAGRVLPAHPRDAGKALRVSRYLTEDPHVRFSVWSSEGVAEAAVSLDEEEAERLAEFLAAPSPPRPGAVERLLARLPRV